MKQGARTQKELKNGPIKKVKVKHIGKILLLHLYGMTKEGKINKVHMIKYDTLMSTAQ